MSIRDEVERQIRMEKAWETKETKQIVEELAKIVKRLEGLSLIITVAALGTWFVVATILMRLAK